MMYRLEKLSGAKFNTVSFRAAPMRSRRSWAGTARTAEIREVMPHVEPGNCSLAVPAMKRPLDCRTFPLEGAGLRIHAGGYRSFVAPAGYARGAGAVGSDARESAKERGMARLHGADMYEDLYMNAEEFTVAGFPAAETTKFLTEMGLALKK